MREEATHSLTLAPTLRRRLVALRQQNPLSSIQTLKLAEPAAVGKRSLSFELLGGVYRLMRLFTKSLQFGTRVLILRAALFSGLLLDRINGETPTCTIC